VVPGACLAGRLSLLAFGHGRFSGAGYAPGKIGDTEPGAMRLPPHSAGSEHPAWRSLAA
jgi:hypothetical protein